MDNRASSRFALVRGCEDSSGLLEFGFGHCISLLFAAFVLMFLVEERSENCRRFHIALQRRPQPLSTVLCGIRAVR